MANDFTKDLSCYALYRMETGALTADSISINTLTSTGTITASSDHQEGGYSVYFNGSAAALHISDANLVSEFPLRSDDATKIISCSLWFKLKTGMTSGDRRLLLGKFDGYGGARRTFALFTTNISGTYYLQMVKGYGTGTAEEVTTLFAFNLAQWYHLGVSYKDSTKAWTARLWNGSTASSNGGTCANALVLSSYCDFNIGGHKYNLLDYGYVPDGYLDEVTISNRILTDGEFDQIRQGIYAHVSVVNNFSGDSTCKAVYDFELGALTTDSKGSNTLTESSGSGTASSFKKQGRYSSYHISNKGFWRENSDLSSYFPLKNGDSIKIFSCTCWFHLTASNTSILTILAKATETLNQLSIKIGYIKIGSKYYVRFCQSHDGTIWNTVDMFEINLNQWYHLGFCYKDSDRSYFARLWNGSTASNESGNCAGSIYIGTGALGVGCVREGTTNATQFMFGYLDEVVFLNSAIDATAIDQIRQQIYTGVNEQMNKIRASMFPVILRYLAGTSAQG